MKRAKFRGKSILKNEWWEGYYIYSKYENKHYIVQDAVYRGEPNGSTAFAHFAEVDPQTVGQYTGLKDKNGKEIYEGDILSSVQNSRGFTVINPVVKFKECEFIVESNTINAVGGYYYERLNYYESISELEIIGNIHENLKSCDVCGSEDVIEVPSMGFNCNCCNPKLK